MVMMGQGQGGEEGEVRDSTYQRERDCEVADRAVRRRRASVLERRTLGQCAFVSLAFACGMAVVGTNLVATALVAEKDFGEGHLATLPMGAMLLAAACVAGTLPLLREEYGTKRVLLPFIALALLGALLQFVAVESMPGTDGGFALLVLGAALEGPAFAVTLLLRTVVNDLVLPSQTHKATALVVLGGCLAAAMGPEVARQTRTVMASSPEHAGTYLLVMGLLALMGILVGLIPLPVHQTRSRFASILPQEPLSEIKECENESASTTPATTPAAAAAAKAVATSAAARTERVTDAGHDSRPASVLLREPVLVLSVATQALAYACMGSLMTGVPLAMDQTGHSYDEITLVVQLHMLSMFLPSVLTPRLNEILGCERTAGLGMLFLLCGCFILLFAGDSVAVFLVGLLFEGTGWNLAFVSATATMLRVDILTDAEMRKVHSLADFTVLFLLAMGMSVAGTIEEEVGWPALVGLIAAFAAVGLLMTEAMHARQSASSGAAGTSDWDVEMESASKMAFSTMYNRQSQRRERRDSREDALPIPPPPDSPPPPSASTALIVAHHGTAGGDADDGVDDSPL